VTFVQRFGSALQLTPHFHSLLTDGVFVKDPADESARPRFHRLAPPSDDEVAAILDRVAGRVTTIPKALLTERLVALPVEKVRAIEQALLVSLGLEAAGRG